MMDFLGRSVSHVITFEEFVDLHKRCPNRCHDFTDYGFLYDEDGVWGLDDSPVGFKTERDCALYRQWLKSRCEE